MACAEEIINIALNLKPDQITLVPERREEITTEGGLDIVGQTKTIQETVKRLQNEGMFVSLFLNPDPKQIEAGIKTGCGAIELHTGNYADAESVKDRDAELHRLQTAGKMICDAGMRLHAGHGLTYRNVLPVALIPNMQELNIGHSIVSRAVLVGMKEAVAEMKRLLESRR